MSDYDSPWKEALDYFLPAFLEFFFPRVHELIDWERGYQSLDKELQQVVREAEVGKRLADKLFQVWLKDGQEAWGADTHRSAEPARGGLPGTDVRLQLSAV